MEEKELRPDPKTRIRVLQESVYSWSVSFFAPYLSEFTYSVWVYPVNFQTAQMYPFKLMITNNQNTAQLQTPQSTAACKLQWCKSGTEGVEIANPYLTGIRTCSVNGTYLRCRSGGQEPETS